ncbi:GerW family sporulation protein [Clostridium botulinum]|uniref:GerW family sporulation protein n=1 Tax=Clostridium botulinum TaxID=1491 RepID=UPI0004D816EE|nr:spore germination protein GerW family protein [Clostridium botulinum]KEI02223.1 sporulation protein [Clostridium botulinum D str. 16868]KOA90377.1 sporulation protein [Clostridium botulinum]MCD3203901.1 sporulation protein [Clostridium botulinum C/D]MCD3222036.1 sporulation protein [Clostridium botulinum C/D]MCD3231939.1 sporulation protein [Clostridium botulinum C/D]
MQLNNNFSDNMNTVFTKVEDYVKHESMMGTPLTVENKTLVPVVSVSLGYGSGNNSPKNKTNPSSCPAEGVGLGAKIATDAVVVIDKDCVSMLPVSQRTNVNINDMMTKLPNVISSLKGGTNTQQNQAQGQQQQQQQNQMQNQASQNQATSIKTK